MSNRLSSWLSADGSCAALAPVFSLSTTNLGPSSDAFHWRPSSWKSLVFRSTIFPWVGLCDEMGACAPRRSGEKVRHELGAGGAQGTVLGCTEIELLIGLRDVPVPTFVTTRLHVRAAIDAALADVGG